MFLLKDQRPVEDRSLTSIDISARPAKTPCLAPRSGLTRSAIFDRWITMPRGRTRTAEGYVATAAIGWRRTTGALGRCGLLENRVAGAERSSTGRQVVAIVVEAPPCGAIPRRDSRSLEIRYGTEFRETSLLRSAAHQPAKRHSESAHSVPGRCRGNAFDVGGPPSRGGGGDCAVGCCFIALHLRKPPLVDFERSGTANSRSHSRSNELAPAEQGTQSRLARRKCDRVLPAQVLTGSRLGGRPADGQWSGVR